MAPQSSVITPLIVIYQLLTTSSCSPTTSSPGSPPPFFPIKRVQPTFWQDIVSMKWMIRPCSSSFSYSTDARYSRMPSISQLLLLSCSFSPSYCTSFGRLRSPSWITSGRVYYGCRIVYPIHRRVTVHMPRVNG